MFEEKLILFAVLKEEEPQVQNQFSKINISVLVKNISEPIIKYSNNCKNLKYEEEKINKFLNDNEVQTTIEALNENDFKENETTESLKFNKSSETSFEILNIVIYSSHIISEEKEQIKELNIILPNITKEAILENIDDIINNTVI